MLSNLFPWLLDQIRQWKRLVSVCYGFNQPFSFPDNQMIQDPGYALQFDAKSDVPDFISILTDSTV